ncbi:uncharacterized protein Tco025E_00171 [Trypanosoma conorhini]|uniref:Uncharacterized protein n=1 Tax=Trypanosoma conorhini TaxID=83891 RepID=A0A3R7SBF9_9TRYP|nr:uncharacterized protein Tco025E_00171 [Trypanosoma conorhini]RNF27610.1 hypothetical protein Tco025E_00171 [Trypanosoma conorhini]
MAEKAMVASPQSSSNSVALFIRDADATAPAFAPIQVNGDVTLQELAEEYCISSVLECDSTGCVQPRAVALDSPLDILRGGRYYIARRDLQRVGRSPRVTFRGKITVEEFEADHALGQQQQQWKENDVSATLPVSPTRAPAAVAAPMHPTKRNRRERDEGCGDADGGGSRREVEGDDEGNIFEGLDVSRCTFVPFLGDLYGDGRETMIQLADVKPLCENVEGDELMFAERHAQAEEVLAGAKRMLLELTPGSSIAENAATQFC